MSVETRILADTPDVTRKKKKREKKKKLHFKPSPSG